MDDLLLLLRMKQGNDEAFEKFVRKYYARILQYCRYHCLDRAYAEDLTQETFLKFFGSLPSYRHLGKVQNYLYTIAGNLCKNLAKKKTAQPLEKELLEQETVSEDMAEKAEIRISVEQALEKLSPDLREVIILFHFQECKLTEIAEILQIGLPLVKYRLKRAREELKQLLGEQGRKGGKYEGGKETESI